MDSRNPARRFRCAQALLPTGWARDVAMDVDDRGTIVAVASNADDPGVGRSIDFATEVETVEVAGAVVPGVPNVHSHAHQRAMAGLAEHAGTGAGQADSFWTWRETMYRFVARMDPDALEAVAAQLYVEMLKAGFTAVGEFQYLHHQPDGVPYDDRAEMTLRCAEAATRAGIGFTALPVLYAHGDFGARPATSGQQRFLNGADGFLRILETVHRQLHGQPNASVGLAPHSLRAVDKALLVTVLDGATAIDPAMPVHIHIAEQQKEVDDCVAWCGQRPVEWLLDHVDVTPRWCAIHATHMTPDEHARLAGTGAAVGVCPTTEANLGDGIFDAPSFLKAGGTLAIGSDSHITVDPADDLRLLEYGQRLRDQARNVLAAAPGRSTGRSLLDRVLRGGAQALGRPIGALAPGYRADFVVLDTAHAALLGRQQDSVLDSWIFAAGRAAVTDVWVGGVPVVSGGRHPEEDTILDRFRGTIARLASGPST